MVLPSLNCGDFCEKLLTFTDYFGIILASDHRFAVNKE